MSVEQVDRLKPSDEVLVVGDALARRHVLVHLRSLRLRKDLPLVEWAPIRHMLSVSLVFRMQVEMGRHTCHRVMLLVANLRASPHRLLTAFVASF